MATDGELELMRLGDLATVKARLGWKGLKADEYVSAGCYFLATPNIKGSRIDFDSASFIPRWRYDESPEIQLQIGDVLLVKDGSTLGTANLVRELPGPTTVNGSIAVVRANPSLDPNYLFQYIQGAAFQDLIRLKKSGLGVPHLFQADLRKFKLFLPELREQRQIATILETIDDAIRKTREIIAKLKQIKQGLLHTLLTRGIDDNGEPRVPERHPERFRDSPVGRIPREWELLTILDVSERTPGSTTIGPFGSNLVAADYREVGVPIVFVRDIRQDGFTWKSNVFVDEAKARALAAHDVRSGDVLVTKMGDPPGTACVYPDNAPSGIVTADVIRIRVDPSRVLAQWVACAVNSQPFQAQVRAAMGGVTRSKLTLGDFRKLRIPVAPAQEQGRILRLLDDLRKRILGEAESSAKLELLKAALTEDLLTSGVRVTSLLESAAE